LLLLFETRQINIKHTQNIVILLFLLSFFTVIIVIIIENTTHYTFDCFIFHCYNKV